jgi:hypothetical protein
MRTLSLTVFAAASALNVGCLRIPTELAAAALDYQVDRPRVIGVSIDPPVLAHGLPVTVDALIVAPLGWGAPTVDLSLCGLRDDIPVDVYNLGCFSQPDLVTPIGDALPLRWEPPDLSGVDCGGEPACVSQVPLLVHATWADEPEGSVPTEAYGELQVFLATQAADPDAELPTSLVDAPRTLTVRGDTRPGAEVTLDYRISARPDGNFRWFVDGGTLLDTGRTTVLRFDAGDALTQNRLQIPADWSGPLRVFVVTQSMAAQMGLAGDQTWTSVTLEVE